MRFAFVPVRCTMLKANLRCRFHFSIAKAIQNPPKNKNTNRLLYVKHVFSTGITPVKGNNTMGTSDVTAMGTASVIHQMSIQATVPSTTAAACGACRGFHIDNTAKANGPPINERYFCCMAEM